MSNLNSINNKAHPPKSSIFEDAEANIDDSEFPEEMFSIVSGIQAPKTNDV